MASRRRNGSRARLSALALLTFGIGAGAAVIAAKAPAGWRPASALSRATRPVLVTSKTVRGLYPRAEKTLTLTLRNSSRRGVVVRAVRVTDAATTKRGCAPSRRNLRIRQPSVRPFPLGPGGRRRVTAHLTMPNSVANACQGAVFRLRYRVVITAGKRTR
jgi:hypothetical protein